jgi:DNA polymerase-1
MAKSKAPAAAAAKNGNGDNKPIRNLYLVDGSGYLFRAYHALPPVNRPDGSAWPPPCTSTAPRAT